jgi:isoamylase
VARLTALRRAHPVLRQRRFLHARTRADGLADVIWHLPDGRPPTPEDWHSADLRCIAVELRMAGAGDDTLFIVLNAGPALPLRLPQSVPNWALVLDTGQPNLSYLPVTGEQIAPAGAVLVYQPLSSEV